MWKRFTARQEWMVVSSDPEAALGGLLEESKGQKSLAHDAHAFVELADRDAPWGIGALQNLLDDARDIRGIGTLDLVTFHHGDRLVARRLIRVIVGRRDLFARGGEVGLEVAGLDECHVNVEGRDFVRE